MTCDNCDCEKCVKILEKRRLKKQGKKRCTVCAVVKDLDQFDISHKNIKRPDCKICRIDANKRVYVKRKDNGKIKYEPTGNPRGRPKNPNKKQYVPTGRSVGRPKGAKNKIIFKKCIYCDKLIEEKKMDKHVEDKHEYIDLDSDTEIEIE
jgi:hypothetical protein